MTTLESVDAEIKRITDEIARLQKEVERPVSPPRANPVIVPDFTNLPDLNNVQLPKGFPRAPVTCPFDPSKAERLNALENELREQLISRNKEDSLSLLRRIMKHQSANKIEYQSKPREVVPIPRTEHDPLAERVLQFLVPSIR